MKLLLFVLFVLLISTCKQPNQRHLPFTKDLKYSAYTLRLNYRQDSFVFYLHHYIDIDSNGRFLVMRHDDWASRSTYFTGFINDTMRQEIDSTFLYKDYQPTYNRSEPGIHDGLFRSIDFKMKGDSAMVIQFDSYSPKQIISLANDLDTLIYSRLNTQIDSFTLVNYEQKLRKYLPPPPHFEKARVYLRGTNKRVIIPK